MIIFHPLLNFLGAIIQFIKHQSDEDGSWIKRKIYNWFLSNAQRLVLMAIVVIGIYLGFKRGSCLSSRWSCIQCVRRKRRIVTVIQ